MGSIRGFLLLALLLAAFSASAECNSNLRIGFITGLSGEAQVWGVAVKNGFEMGLNDSGCSSMVRFYEDDQFTPVKSVTAFRRLVEENHANIIILTSSATGNVVAPLAERHGVPLFAWASDLNVAKNRSMVVRTWSSGEDEGDLIGAEVEKLKYQRIARLSTVHDYPLSVGVGLARSVPAEKLLPSRELAPNVKDFQTEIALARTRQADAFYACLMVPGSNGLLARQMRQVRFGIPIFGCEALELGSNFQESGGALAGAWFVTGGVRPEFEQRYRALYGEPGTSGGAALHYDLARILAATKASSSTALIDEVLGKEWAAQGLLALRPFRGNGDQALKVKLVVRHFGPDGRILEGVE